MERSLYKAVEELQKLQARRRSREAAVASVHALSAPQQAHSLAAGELPALNPAATQQDKMALFGRDRGAETALMPKAPPRGKI